jgi:hypothetical protein
MCHPPATFHRGLSGLPDWTVALYAAQVIWAAGHFLIVFAGYEFAQIDIWPRPGRGDMPDFRLLGSVRGRSSICVQTSPAFRFQYRRRRLAQTTDFLDVPLIVAQKATVFHEHVKNLSCIRVFCCFARQYPAFRTASGIGCEEQDASPNEARPTITLFGSRTRTHGI